MTIDELIFSIQNITYGKAKIDSEYVKVINLEHLYEYSFNFPEFLQNMKDILEKTKNETNNK